MSATDTTLLFGPYTPPRGLWKGRRAYCLYCHGPVVITGWSDGRISWPRCQRRGQHGGSGLLVDDELARAIQSESAAALKFWWGVSNKAVWNWRKAFAVGRMGNPGSRRLIQAASAKVADATRGVPLPEEQVAIRRENARRNNQGQYLRHVRYVNGRAWTADEIALLGKRPDREVAERLGRSVRSVISKRQRLGICIRRRLA